MVFRSLREYRRVGRLLSQDSAWLGRCWAATRLRSGPAMPFITIPPGAWARKGFGRIRHSLPRPMHSELHNRLVRPAVLLPRRTAPRSLTYRSRGVVVWHFRLLTARRIFLHLRERFFSN